MCSVGRSECVTYIDVSQVSQLFAELLTVLGLFCTTETGILKKNYISVFHVLNSFGSCLSGYMIIGYKYNLFAKFLGKTFCNRCKGLSLVRAILYFSKMGAENYFSSVSDELFDGRKCCYDTGLICDHAIFQRNVEIASNQDTFALCVDIIDRFLI